ncbi:hypothetical protein EPO56_03870 [Patescibacteria group bacterium]|nr:MAG: hypothetical protein EPO56_03870 [Patescibacteria group bacterium]
MDERVDALEREVALLKERNSRVESEKAWETSLFRVCTIAFLTYVFASVFLAFVGVQEYLLNALVPTIGFVLSTRSIPIIKKAWLRFQKDKKN